MELKFQVYSVAVWTPGIGGIFGDMKLKLKPFLKKEKNKVWMLGLCRKHKISGTDFIAQAMHPGMAQDMVDKYLSLIEDWEGCTAGGEKVPCTTENKKKYLEPLFDDLTGQIIKKDLGDKCFTLMLYIAAFTENIENYQKNSSGTASAGSLGGEIGAGSKKSSPAT